MSRAVAPHRAGGATAVLLAGAAAIAAPAGAAPPAPGRYPAELCVTAASGPPGCGAAAVDVARGGRINVRVNDLVYHLQLHSSQLDLVLMHGFVQVDAFTANYDWIGRALQFVDADRQTRYELRLVPPK